MIRSSPSAVVAISAALFFAACGDDPKAPATPPATLDDGGASIVDAAPEPASPDDAHVDDASAPIKGAYDVVVYGAGAGGIAAALAASRMGRSVALLEPTSHVGAQLITVTSMDEAGSTTDPQLPGNANDGIYGEFMARVTARYAAMTPPHSVHTDYFTDLGRAYEPHVGETILREMLAERSTAGAPFALLTKTSVVAVDKDASGAVIGVRTAAGERYASKVLVDASEYGDLLPLAGAAYRVGNGKWDPATGEKPDPHACVQNMTYPATIRAFASYAAIPSGLDLRAAGAPGSDYAQMVAKFRVVVTNAGPGVTHGAMVPVPWDFPTHNQYRGVPDSDGASYTGKDVDLITKTMVNGAVNDYPANAYPNIGSAGVAVGDFEDLTSRRALDCRARLRTLQLIHYFQDDAGGLGYPWALADENGPWGAADDCDAAIVPPSLAVASRLFPPLPYVREGRRVVGVETVTGKDIVRSGPKTMPAWPASAAKRYATSLLVEYHLPDLHGCNVDPTFEADLDETQSDRQEGANAGPFQVPFGSFVPKSVDGLLVAEKNLSMSRIVSSDVRLHAPSMTSGQAAGIIAALAVAKDTRVRDVPPVLVQRALAQAGSTISADGFTDVTRAHRRWSDVQLVSTHGIMRGTGALAFSPDTPLTRGQAALVLVRALHLHVANPPDWTPLVGFADVPTTHVAYAAIEALAREGITLGCGTSAGTPLYCPDSPMTRAQLVTWMVRALEPASSGPAACTTAPFADVPVGHALCSHIARARDLMLTEACSGGGFCPDEVVIRGDAAAFVGRLLEQLASTSTPRGACYRTPPAYCPDN